MIEEYIEKSILRQLFLCGQFYVNKEINLDTCSTLLQVCKTTLLNDIKNLTKELEESIVYRQREKERYSLYFSENVSRFQLMQRIARHSLFLKTCLLYLENEPDYIQLTEIEFVSVSKAYSLKKQVLSYFQECGITIEHCSPRFSEMERRLLLLNVYYRLGFSNGEKVPSDYMDHANRFINAVTEKCGRIYNKENREILRIGFLISYLNQHKHPLIIDLPFVEALKKRPVYRFVADAWQNDAFKEYYYDDEFYFILSLFNLCDYGFDSYEAIEKDFRQLHQVFIEESDEIQALISLFEEHFDRAFFGNRPFERALIHLMRSTWDNYQLFMPEKFYLLTPDQLQLLKVVQSLIHTWSKRLPYDLRINSNCLRAFVVELSGILRLDKTQLQAFIVTNSDVNYLIYRDALESVSTCTIQVTPTIYNKLSEELIILADQSDHRVFCERTLYTKAATCCPNIVPITVDTIEQSILLAVQQ
ncbi:MULTISPECIES: DNA-binding protein [unclassified Enterococcus]|uniref:DNA-binding protein n=1 Tax=unclassified Enterococcus TaxID=2608891 RepID=UPI0013EA3C56|nr:MULTISPECIES: DNA-binding protein [unclassified Enterococcus]